MIVDVVQGFNSRRGRLGLVERIGRSGLQGKCGPKLNPKDAEYWYKQPGAPWPKLANEKPPGKTMPYDQIMKEMLSGKLPL